MLQATGRGADVAPAQAPAAPGAPATPEAAPAPTRVVTTIPRGGARLTVEDDGDRTTFTLSPLPPQMVHLVRGAQQTAFGLMGLLAAIIILGPFARMWARRLEKRSEMKSMEAAGVNAQLLQKQLLELQQSVDAMSVEVERISESQRFQSKLLNERQSV